MREYGVGLVGGCCGTTPGHIAPGPGRLDGATPARPAAGASRASSSIYHHVPFRQDASVLMVGERTNANGSKAFREAMLAGDWQTCVEIARGQARDGSHLLDLCVDYVGRDGAADMRELAGRFATASTLPIMLDSTEPAVIEAGLEMLGGRCVVNSVNFEDGDGPTSRYARVMPMIREHGAAVVAMTIDEEGQARTAEWKVRVAARLIDDLTGRWGMAPPDIFVDCLTFPISTGQEETRRDGIETIEAIRELEQRTRGCNFTLGISNVSFGLNPAARQVLNSVFLHECAAGRAGLGDRARLEDPADVEDPGGAARGRARPGLRPAAPRGGYDPLQRFLELFEGGRRGLGPGVARRGAGRAAAGRAAAAADHRRRAQRPGGRPRRRAAAPARAGDHQRRRCWPA